MKYFYIPGRNFELSKAEINAVLKTFLLEKYSLEYAGNYILVTTTSSLDEMLRIFNRLGGFISFGVVYDDIDKILEEFSTSNEKVNFGISVYTDDRDKYRKTNIKQVLEQIKQYFKERDIKSRYILPSVLTLDTAQILHNGLIDKGFELVILDEKGKKLYGRTYGVQDIELYSKVEFDKPYTNKELGVLPAKLARILVNLAGLKSGSTIWDSFCGSGTIPIMSLLANYNVLASDYDPEAVEGTQRNVEWLSKQGVLGDVKYNVFKLDVLNPDSRILKDIRNTDFNGLVCEPFMGPPQFKILNPHKAQKLLGDVESLFKAVFAILEHSKLDEFKAVIVIPSYKTFDGWMTLSVNRILSKKWKVENNLSEDLHWKRSNSIIKRNIFVLSKKN